MPIFWLLFLVGALGICSVGFLSFAHLSSHLAHGAKGGGAKGLVSHSTSGHANGLHPGHHNVRVKSSDPTAVQNGSLPPHIAGNLSSVGHRGQGTNLPQNPQNSVTENVGAMSGFVQWSISHLLISPVDIFAFCLGAGATGLVLESVINQKWLIVAVVTGALLMRYGIMQPIMNFILGFASKPSDGLEGLIAAEAQVVSSFNKEGKGLVQLELDGQIRQVLAQLDFPEIPNATLIARGDHLIVLDVDPKRNTCVVSRDLANQSSIP